MKKLIPLLLVAAMVIALVTGCSQKAATTSGPIKDEIVFAQGDDLTTMDPNEGTQERAYSLTNHIYDSLLAYDSQMKLVPSLATEWKWLNDLSLEFKLREGVKFQNGDPFTSEDVEFTLLKIQKRGGLLVGTLDYVEKVSPTDCIIHLTKPLPTLVYYFTDPAWSIVPKNYYNADPTGFAAKPIGTGPYMMKEYVSGDHYTLERFDGYWGEPAKTKLLTMKIVPDSGQRTILLQTGEVDVAYGIPYNDIARITANKDLQLLTTPSVKIVMLYCNTASKGPISNPDVRKAIEYAMDKQSLVQAVTDGHGTATWTVVPSTVTDYVEQQGYRFDVAKAKEMLAKAGYPNGFNLKIWTVSDQANTELCQILQSQLAEIGIKLEIIVQDANTTNTLRTTEDYGLILHFFQCNIGHAEYTLYWTMRSGSGSNFANFSNKEYDLTVDKWKNTIDPAQRATLLAKLYQIEQEQLPEIPVFNEVKVLGATAKLQGIELSQIGAHQFQNAVVYK